MSGTNPVTDKGNLFKVKEARMEPLASLTSKAFLTDGGGWVAEQDGHSGVTLGVAAVAFQELGGSSSWLKLGSFRLGLCQRLMTL